MIPRAVVGVALLGLAGVYAFELATGRSVLPGRIDWSEERVRINGAIRSIGFVVIAVVVLLG